MKNKTLAIISVLLLAAVLLCGCSQKKVIPGTDTDTTAAIKPTSAKTEATIAPIKPTASQKPTEGGSYYDKYFGNGSNTVTLDKSSITSDGPIVVMKIENKGYVVITLYPQNAPNTVNNFISRVANGEYDGISFFNFNSRLGVLSSTIDAGYTLEFEKVASPIIRRSENIVFMNKDASTGDTMGADFFICLDESLQKDFDNGLFREYTAIGEVMEGIEIFERAVSGFSGSSAPLADILTVEQCVVDLNGYTITETVKK